MGTSKFLSFNFTILLLISFLVINCGEQQKQIPKPQAEVEEHVISTDQELGSEMSPDQYKELLANCWKHAREEDIEGSNMNFRTCDNEFPASRFRNTFTLLADGTATYLVLAPNDRHYSAKGFWTLDYPLLIIKDEAGEKVTSYEVVNLDSQGMKLSKID